MTYAYNEIKVKFFEFLPLLLLFFISLSGNSVMNLKFFSLNIHYILVYYWVLRHPQALGYGFVFLSGIITDVVLGLPLGITALSLLVIAGTAAYIRVVTVRITLLNDWISFIPAILFANFIYFISLYYSNFSINRFKKLKYEIIKNRYKFEKNKHSFLNYSKH